MKIVTWNCNMAFRKKLPIIADLNPDIVVVPECEKPDRFQLDQYSQKPTDLLWHGNNPNKGLGVFSFSEYRLKLLENHNDSFRTVLPILVSKKEFEFLLFAIWANNPAEKGSQYIEQVWKAIHFYEELLNTNTLLIGDFNSNTIWDKQHREGSHSAVVKKLSGKGIQSVYHLFYKQEQGKELHPTFFTYRHKDKPYHIDYCFASDYFIKRLEQVEVGSYEQWTAYSDHKPLIVTFSTDPINNKD
jgi:exodeoxyribonuclease III